MPYKDTTATVAARVNIGSDLAPKFVGRDSPQVATRVPPGCLHTAIPAPRRPGGDPDRRPLRRRVRLGRRLRRPHGRRLRRGRDRGRPARHRLHRRTARPQNQVRGQAVVLGSPFPVPAANRFAPALPGDQTRVCRFRGVQLTLDHVILRAADPARARSQELAERSRARRCSCPSTRRAPFTSGIVRASVDIEVLAIGAAPPPRVAGLRARLHRRRPARRGVDAALRAAGFPTSVATGATANGRTWAAVQVHGLLPDPFPLPARPRSAQA